MRLSLRHSNTNSDQASMPTVQKRHFRTIPHSIPHPTTHAPLLHSPTRRSSAHRPIIVLHHATLTAPLQHQLRPSQHAYGTKTPLSHNSKEHSPPHNSCTTPPISAIYSVFASSHHSSTPCDSHYATPTPTPTKPACLPYKNATFAQFHIAFPTPPLTHHYSIPLHVALPRIVPS